MHFQKRYVREVYSAYLLGLSYEEIVDRLEIRGMSVDEATIDEIIDLSNAANGV